MKETFKLISKKRLSWFEVEVTYAINNVLFSVFWTTIDEDGYISSCYYLEDKVESLDDDIKERVLKAIRYGDVYNNSDLELYLFIRDKYNSEDAYNESHDIKINNISYYDPYSDGLKVDAEIDGEDMSYLMQLPLTPESQISVLAGDDNMYYDLLIDIAKCAEEYHGILI